MRFSLTDISFMEREIPELSDFLQTVRNAMEKEEYGLANETDEKTLRAFKKLFYKDWNIVKKHIRELQAETKKPLKSYRIPVHLH